MVKSTLEEFSVTKYLYFLIYIMSRYIPNQIESKWQEYWEREKIYHAEVDNNKPKYYALVMFPYPSGDGLHVGHTRNYIAGDITARYKRMQGHNVIHPIGWDAFGLPAENAAIKKGIHPRANTNKNIANFKKQIKSIGISYDWDREIDTTDPNYYRWTQWIFLKLFKRGLAYQEEAPVNWCPSCKTGLANEEVVAGACERCGTNVEKRYLKQWILKITEYADRLLTDLDELDWPKKIKLMQQNWIGRSEGAIIKFQVKNSKLINVFTTRPDTLFGATYLVLAPEHKLVQELKGKVENWMEVEAYVNQVKNKSDLERTALVKDKTGVELKGIKAVNPINNKELPIWIADYVLASYGTGAIMAVPAHDERDYEFAKKFHLPIKQVIARQLDNYRSYLMGAEDVSDEELNNLEISVVESLEGGSRKIEIPRGNLDVYWKLLEEKLTPGFWNEVVGEDIIFLFKHKDGKIEKLELTTESEKKIDELAKEFSGVDNNSAETVWGWLANNDWYTDFVIHAEAGRLVNSEKYNTLFSEEAKEKITQDLARHDQGKKAVNYKLRDWVFSRQRYWGEPIPVIHCEKCGIVPVPEKDLPVTLPEVERYEPTGTGESPLALVPEFINTICPQCGGQARRETNTMPQWAGSCWYYLRYTDSRNNQEIFNKEKMEYWMPVDIYTGGAEHAVLHLLYARFWNKALYDEKIIPFKEPFLKLRNQGMVLGEGGIKMSKSKGNVVNPDDIVNRYGADTLRIYEMFMGPFEDAISWDPKSIEGSYRFLHRVWHFVTQARVGDGESKELVHYLHRLIQKITHDVEAMKFNTMVSAFMEFVNFAIKEKEVKRETLRTFLKLFAPLAPHASEELWHHLDSVASSIHQEQWPQYDPELVREETVELVVQVNGRIRDNFSVSAGIEEEKLKQLTLGREKVKKYVEGKGIKKVIVIKGRLINIVV